METLKLDEHTLASALDPDELARLEFEPDHMAIIFKRPRELLQRRQVRVPGRLDGAVPVRRQAGHRPVGGRAAVRGQAVRQASPRCQDLVLKIIYSSIFHFVEHLKVINAVSDSLEEQINTSMQNKYLLNLFSLEKSLVYYLNAINSNAKLIERLKHSAAKIGFSRENLEFIDDMIIENSQCYEQAEIYSNILASMMDARVSIVSNNLNWLMKTLTIITIAIMLPTLVVSIFSMNVEFPGPEHPGDVLGDHRPGVDVHRSGSRRLVVEEMVRTKLI